MACDERLNRYHHALPADPSSGKQLSPAWHTLCLNHEGLRKYILEQAREVAQKYPTQGPFFDIILTPDCVCPACVERMQCNGLDPENAADRLKNDEAVNEQFRRGNQRSAVCRISGLCASSTIAVISTSQGTGTLLNLFASGAGEPYRRADGAMITSLQRPLCSDARHDFLAHTGKFHTSWGEDSAASKHPDALEYECAQMVALGLEMLVGDQLSSNGAINPDTYRSVAPAYARVEKLEPFLEGAKQISEIAILSAEHMSPSARATIRATTAQRKCCRS